MATDIDTQSPILKFAPRCIEPWIRLTRLDRPAGILLLMLPAFWGIAAASLPAFPDPGNLFLFAVGAILMRSAGVICNDLTDRKFDVLTERTRTRPLADGSMSFTGAMILMVVLLILATLILFQLNFPTIVLGLISVAMTFIYPWMKRITFWPQAFLGLTFNIGLLMGWTLVRGKLELSAFFMYAGTFFWTLHYDTTYAFQDVKDDALIGVKSSALRLGNRTLPFLLTCTTCFSVLMTSAGVFLNLPFVYFLMISLSTALLFFESFVTDLSNPDACLKAFRRAHRAGWIVFLGLLFSTGAHSH